MNQHVVIVGYGRIGGHLVEVLQSLQFSILVIESDFERVDELNERHIATLYGDPANSEVIRYAGLERARAVVITIPDEAAAAIIVASARRINPKIPIIVRAATEEGVRMLSQLGANHIVHPELEGGLEMVIHTLLKLGFPLREVHEYSEAVRRDHYDVQLSTADEHSSLRDLVVASESIEIHWARLEEGSPVVGRSLLEANIRSRTGASVVAMLRSRKLIANPKSSTIFEAGDQVGLIGEADQIRDAHAWLCEGRLPSPREEEVLETRPRSLPAV